MKIKTYLAVLLPIYFFIGLTNGYAQCIPDNSITQPGFYPDSSTNLPHGAVGLPYLEVINVKVQTDTVISSIAATVDSIVIANITGLPAGFSYSTSSLTNSFPGGSNACILIDGSPTSGMVGSYPLDISVIMYGKMGGTIPYSYPFLVSYYIIEIDLYAAFNTIKGKCFLDYNNDAVQNNGEPGFRGVTVKSVGSSVTKLAKPATQGVFAVNIHSSGVFQTTLTNVSSIYNVTPLQHTSTFSAFNEVDSVDFALWPIPGIRDIRIAMYATTSHRLGRDVVYRIEYSNAGTDTVSGTIVLVKDSLLSLVSASPNYAGVSGDSITWTYANLMPAESRSIDVTLHVPIPPTLVPGDRLSSLAYITPFAPNLNPTENYAYLNDQAVGSYDPNDKKSLFGDEITRAQIDSGQYLTYLIRFQNTGNDTAFIVVVKDTLDSKLDLNTFSMVSASHNYEVGIDNQRMVSFTFDNILLVDSNKNEPASHGYICYRIKPKNTLTEGEVINNTAHIFFDFNPAVVTNTASTTVVLPVAVKEIALQGVGLYLYPNPARDRLMIYSSSALAKEVVTISVMNVLGQQTSPPAPLLMERGVASIDVSKLRGGIYFVELKGEKGRVVKRFVKE